VGGRFSRRPRAPAVGCRLSSVLHLCAFMGMYAALLLGTFLYCIELPSASNIIRIRLAPPIPSSIHGAACAPWQLRWAFCCSTLTGCLDITIMFACDPGSTLCTFPVQPNQAESSRTSGPPGAGGCGRWSGPGTFAAKHHCRRHTSHPCPALCVGLFQS
jgi:hypothetical protein